jgi:hypothetical protein
LYFHKLQDRTKVSVKTIKKNIPGQERETNKHGLKVVFVFICQVHQKGRLLTKMLTKMTKQTTL